MNCKFKYCNDVTGKNPAPFYVQINQNIFLTGLLGFEKPKSHFAILVLNQSPVSTIFSIV